MAVFHPLHSVCESHADLFVYKAGLLRGLLTRNPATLILHRLTPITFIDQLADHGERVTVCPFDPRLLCLAR